MVKKKEKERKERGHLNIKLDAGCKGVIDFELPEKLSHKEAGLLLLFLERAKRMVMGDKDRDEELVD